MSIIPPLKVKTSSTFRPRLYPVLDQDFEYLCQEEDEKFLEKSLDNAFDSDYLEDINTN